MEKAIGNSNLEKKGRVGPVRASVRNNYNTDNQLMCRSILQLDAKTVPGHENHKVSIAKDEEGERGRVM